MHLSRPSIRSLMASGAVLGLLIAFGPAASASVAPAGGAASSASANSRAAAAAARAVIRQLSIGQPGTDHRVGGHSTRVNGLTQVYSTNWSGYADDNSTGHTYSTVSGSWSEPAVSCSSNQTTYAVFWVGIDGYSSGSVEQDGTLAECYHHTAYYYTWWEMYPSNAIQTVGSSVSPGDSISASVVRSGTSYTLKVTDSTHPANSFSTTQSCSCANSSAEWIAEAPSSGRILPLANFGTWNLTGAAVDSGTISSFPDDEITMVNNSGGVKAQPGPLNGTGTAFSVTWRSSS
jgi:Peptidase A4 family